MSVRPSDHEGISMSEHLKTTKDQHTKGKAKIKKSNKGEEPKESK